MPNEKTDKLKNSVLKAKNAENDLFAELEALEGSKEPNKKAITAKKAAVKKAAAAVKKAEAAVAKQEAADKKKEQSAAAKVEREAKTAAKKADAEAKAKAKEEEKSAKVAEREANRMPEQNGIRHPKSTTVCGQVWTMADDLSKQFKQPTPIKELLEATAKKGMNDGNVKAEYARWRKFHGVTGRVSLPKKEDAVK